MSLALRCALRPVLRTKLELRQELSHLFTGFVEQILPKSEFIREALQAVRTRMPGGDSPDDPSTDQALIDTIVANVPRLCNSEKGTWQRIAVEYLFRMQTGDSERGTVTFESESGLTPSDLVLTYLQQAFSDPDRVRHEIETLDVALEAKSSDYAGTLQQRREYVTALDVAEAITEPVLLMSTYLQALFAIRVEGAEVPCLTAACRRIMLLEKFMPLCSERFLKRFDDRFKSLGASASRLQNAFLNTVGEYVLLGFGILSPNVFQLYGWSVTKAKGYEGLPAELSVLGIPLEGILKQPTGMMFCNRWAVTGMRPTAETDDLILNFITRTVRRDASILFRAFSFDDFLDKLQQGSDEAESKEEERIAKGEVLLDILSSGDFRDLLMKRAADTWYPALKRFLP